ncbi:sensor histidine kinase [Phytomonospora endophytica]|uniref:histidine kinase n=1 Tax=Phytomonospora endophytica TaxID=714109 RepID=A0A841FIV4_9ACTN|nr:ATP-binding protein [Phytomonospora endophytica]MBB6037261.1 signal transduction histidine kinase [Phytomonospora endophytica]GIG71238.1 two-component sensor histidine kinase [Phytomonospora endophytica]
MAAESTARFSIARLLPQSVRWRTTLGATLVVAVVLLVAGAAVVGLLRANLIDGAQAQAELAAREVGAQLAAGTAPNKAEATEDDVLLQIGGPRGVLAESEDLTEAAMVLDFAGEPDGASSTDDDDDDDTEYAGTVEPEAAYETLDVPGEDGPFRFAAVTVTMPSGTQYVVYAGASLATQNKAVADAARYMLVALPGILLVVAVVTWLVTRRALRPVAAIRAELASITAGDLSRRVPEPPSRDEIGDLARTTNATLAQLESSVDRQRRFIADASHELRSPIATLRAQLEVGAAHPELLRPDGLLDDVVRLQRLATDLLLLARLDAGEGATAAPVDLTETVRETVARRAAADEFPVRLGVEEELGVNGIRGQLERVLGNLMDNAQRHARSTVAVTLRAEGRGVVLLVEDDGPGIPPERRASVFDRFVRLDDARSRDDGGAGLGLAIVRDVVAAHGGTVRLGESPLGGAAFRVDLPRASRA